jgi:hypothetical protein
MENIRKEIMRYFQLFTKKNSSKLQESVMDKMFKILEMYGVSNEIILDESVTQLTDEDVDVRELRTFLSGLPFVKKKLTSENVNQEFYPVLVDVVLKPRFVGISKFDKRSKLMDVKKSGHGEEYVFQCDDRVVEFPESSSDHTSGLLRFRVMLNDATEYSKFMTEFVLKFSAWDIKEKIF